MVNIGKKLPDVAFQNPNGPSMVPRDFSRVKPESINTALHPFVKTARKGVKNKLSVIKRIQGAVNGVVDETVPHARFVNITRFWIVNLKCKIWSMLVCFIFQLMMQRNDVIHYV